MLFSIVSKTITGNWNRCNVIAVVWDFIGNCFFSQRFFRYSYNIFAYERVRLEGTIGFNGDLSISCGSLIVVSQSVIIFIKSNIPIFHRNSVKTWDNIDGLPMLQKLDKTSFSSLCLIAIN